MEMQKVLLVDDSLDCQVLVRRLLQKKYAVHCVSSAEMAREELRSSAYDLVLLDVGLPGIDGFKFCAEIKAIDGLSEIPIIFLTARAGVEDKILGFSVGADDFIVKPFDLREFCARVDSKLRKVSQLNSHRDAYMRGQFRVDAATQKICLISGSEELDLELSSMEFKLLLYFINNEGKVLSRDQLLEYVWGPNTHVGERTVDTHVYTLRKKLGPEAVTIKSITGEGYQFVQSVVPFQGAA